MLFRKASFTALVAVLLFPAMALAFGEVRQADRDLNVRKERTLTSAHVKTLKKGEKVRTEFLKDGWVAVFDLDATVRDETGALGYSNVKYLKLVSGTGKDGAPQKTAQQPAKTMEKAAPAKTAAKAPAKAAATPSAPKKTPPAQPGPEPAAAPKTKAKTAAEAVIAATPGSTTKPAQLPSQAATPATPPAPDKAEIKGKVVPAPQKTAEDSPHAQGAPVKITSDRMVYDDAQGTVSFEGNVHATHSSLSLWASKVTAYFAKKGEGGNPAENVDRILATGGVRMRYQDRVTGNCDQLLYTVKNGILRMQGNPILEDGPNRIQGQEIRFYLKDNRSEVVGGKGKRVEATFITPEDFKAP